MNQIISDEGYDYKVYEDKKKKSFGVGIMSILNSEKYRWVATIGRKERKFKYFMSAAKWLAEFGFTTEGNVI